MIYIAANYINGTDLLAADSGDIDGVGFGHLQLVMGAYEIEVQAPFDYWKTTVAQATILGVISPVPGGGLLGGTVGGIWALTHGTWVFDPNEDRSHAAETNYYTTGPSEYYGNAAIDISYAGSDRTEDDVWGLWQQINEQFAAQASIHYSLNSNSNSYITTLMQMMGLSSASYVDILENNLDSIGAFPGADNSILESVSVDFNLIGSNNGDVIFTGIGNDTLSGQDGNDQFHTGKGDDILIGDKGADLLDGGDDNDTADYSGTLGNADSSGTQGISADIAVDLDAEVTASVIDNWGATDTLISIESITGTEFADRFALTGPAVAIAAGIGILDAGESPVELGDTIDFSDVSSVNGLIISLDEGLPRQRHKQLWQLFG